MPISKKAAAAWLFSSLLLAMGCGPTTEAKRFEVADDESAKTDSAKTEEVATKSNSDFAENAAKRAVEASSDDAAKEEEMAVAAKADPDEEMTAQEPTQKSGKKETAKKGDEEAEQEPPAKKSIAELELPKDGKLEDYEALLTEVLSNRPKSEADQKKMIGLIKEASAKIVELEKDQNSDRWKQAFNLQLQIKLMELGPKLQAFIQAEEGKKEEAKKELQTEVDKYVEPLNERKADESLAQGVGMLVESLMRIPDAGIAEINKGVAEKFAPKFEAAEDEQLKKVGEQLRKIVHIADGIKRFAELPGNEMELTGKTVAGDEFDVKQWKGKVVLVDFWATWCGPCVAEYPNMLKNYKAYHDKGFEIIGVSGDHKLEALTEYIEKKKVPWPNMYVEGGHPAMEHYGIMSIPTMVLIGRDGKVISTEARGEVLDEELEKLFAEEGEKKEGDAKEEPKKEEAKSEEPKAEEKPEAKEEAPKEEKPKEEKPKEEKPKEEPAKEEKPGA